jgi:FixJ family two-component response regulator
LSGERELGSPACGPALIAVVDDDQAVRFALNRLLRSKGFAVATYASAEAFLERAEHDRPQCLVLDINLGGMNGFELRDALTRLGAEIPVVFITAQDDSATRENVLRASGTPCLRKPFEQGVLLDAIRQAAGVA